MYVNFLILVKQSSQALKPVSYKKPKLHKSNQNKTTGSAITENFEWETSRFLAEILKPWENYLWPRYCQFLSLILHTIINLSQDTSSRLYTLQEEHSLLTGSQTFYNGCLWEFC